MNLDAFVQTNNSRNATAEMLCAYAHSYELKSIICTNKHGVYTNTCSVIYVYTDVIS